MAEYRRMTDKQLRRARVLIKKLCANAEEINKRYYCLPLDMGYERCLCPQRSSYTLICKYFRAAVLPTDRELYAELMSPENSKCCAACGKPFYPHSNHTLYCDKCKRENERRRTRERVRRYRSSK